MTRSPERRSGPARRGWTLIEMLMVCTTIGVLAVSGVVTIATLMSAESRGAGALVQQNTVSRLSAQFRDDLHSAREAVVGDVDGGERNQLLLQLPDDSTITWRITQDAIERLVDRNAAEGPRERYHLPDRQMSFESAGDTRVTRLVIQSPGQPISDTSAGDHAPPATRRLTIEAALAWDLHRSLLESEESGNR